MFNALFSCQEILKEKMRTFVRKEKKKRNQNLNSQSIIVFNIKKYYNLPNVLNHPF